MDKESPKKFEKSEGPKKPESAFSSELRRLGCKVDIVTGGDIQVDNFELEPSAILSRWEKIFGSVIQNQSIPKETLEQWANRLSEESRKIVDWIKAQSHPEQYEVTHFINPFTGEHIRVDKKNEVKRIYGVFVRFERGRAVFEADESFLEEKEAQEAQNQAM